MLVKLNEICNFQEGYVNPLQTNPSYFDGDVKWVRANDVNYSKIYNTSRTLTQKGFKSAGKSALLFEPNSIVVTKSGTIGRCAIINDYMCGNRAIINVCLKNNSLIDTLYVYYYLSTLQEYLTTIAVGSVQKNLYTSILGNVQINFKSTEERQHIVNILGSIDEKIENNEQKIVKIKELMARLYENISLNKDCVKIGDLTCEIKERLDDRTTRAFSVINSGELVEQDSYFDRQIHSKDMYKYKVIRKYNFAYNPSRINIGSVAMFEHDFGAVSPIYIAFSCNKKYSYYINEFIKTEQFNKEICLRANGSVRQSVNYDVFVEIQIPLPDESELTKYNDEYAILQENIDSLKEENTKLNSLKNLYLKKFFG